MIRLELGIRLGLRRRLGAMDETRAKDKARGSRAMVAIGPMAYQPVAWLLYFVRTTS